MDLGQIDLGPSLRVIEKASVVLYTDNGKEWVTTISGFLFFIKDHERKAYYIQVYDEAFQLFLDFKFHSRVRYRQDALTFHSFGRTELFGLHFYYESEANKFYDCISQRSQGRQKSVSKQQISSNEVSKAPERKTSHPSLISLGLTTVERKKKSIPSQNLESKDKKRGKKGFFFNMLFNRPSRSQQNTRKEIQLYNDTAQNPESFSEDNPYENDESPADFSYHRSPLNRMLNKNSYHLDQVEYVDVNQAGEMKRASLYPDEPVQPINKICHNSAVAINEMQSSANTPFHWQHEEPTPHMHDDVNSNSIDGIDNQADELYMDTSTSTYPHHPNYGKNWRQAQSNSSVNQNFGSSDAGDYIDASSALNNEEEMEIYVDVNPASNYHPPPLPQKTTKQNPNLGTKELLDREIPQFGHHIPGSTQTLFQPSRLRTDISAGKPPPNINETFSVDKLEAINIKENIQETNSKKVTEEPDGNSQSSFLDFPPPPPVFESENILGHPAVKSTRFESTEPRPFPRHRSSIPPPSVLNLHENLEASNSTPTRETGACARTNLLADIKTGITLKKTKPNNSEKSKSSRNNPLLEVLKKRSATIHISDSDSDQFDSEDEESWALAD